MKPSTRPLTDWLKAPGKHLLHQHQMTQAMRERTHAHYRALVDIVHTLQQRVSVRDEILRTIMKRTTTVEMNRTMSDVQLQSQEIIKTDAPVFDDIDSASEALLARWEDAEKPSEQETDVATEPADEETEQLDQEAEEDEADLEDEEADEDPEEEEEAEETEEDEEEEITLDDDTLVEIMVDGEAQQASIAQLKRLYGQEASLTRKSQDVAKQRKQAEEAIGKTNVVLQRMLEKAEERYKPYSEVDMLVASKSMTTEDFAQLRKEAQTAADDVNS